VPQPATTGRQLLSRPERQASILRAAASAFARAGFADTSMDDVATAAGVTKLIVYRHFESKEELYRAVLGEVEEHLREAFTTRMAADDRRGVTVRTMLEAGRAHPDGLRLLLLHAQHEPRFAHHAAELRRQAIAVAELLIGDTLPDPVVHRWAIQTLVTYVFGTVLEWLDVGDPAHDDRFVAMATDALVAMYRSWLPTGA
jgi:AcrR family transcriptional regulator